MKTAALITPEEEQGPMSRFPSSFIIGRKAGNINSDKGFNSVPLGL